MKLGEIKLETLMLISPSDELRCDTEDDEELRRRLSQLEGDSNYNDYLASMPGAINRCFSSLENKGLVPSKSYELDNSSATRQGKYLLFSLEEISDLGHIEKVLHYSEFSYIRQTDYMTVGDTEILLEAKDGRYVVIYTPIVERVRQTTDDARVIKLSEDLCAIIPYFLKSELLRAENENEAAVARNVFEAMAAVLTDKSDGYQTKVESVYEVPI